MAAMAFGPQSISEVTQRNIMDYLSAEGVPWSERLEEPAFLDHIWDLAEMPSTDSRFSDAPLRCPALNLSSRQMGRARGGQASRSGARRGTSVAAPVVAARATFATFRDERTSPFYCAEGLTPEETWNVISEQVAVVAAEVVAQASEGYVAVPRDVRLWHERIFGPWFPTQAGHQRVGEERSQFDVVWGTTDRPQPETLVSCKGSSVPKRLGEAFGALRGAIEERDAAVADERQRKLREATLPAAKFYAKLLSTHPFFDGNGRVAYVALQYALVRLGATGVALPDHDEQQWALGQALRRGGRHQNYEALAVLFEETIRASSSRASTIKKP
jgi:prophage maintenance system killer protein